MATEKPAAENGTAAKDGAVPAGTGEVSAEMAGELEGPRRSLLDVMLERHAASGKGAFVNRCVVVGTLANKAASADDVTGVIKGLLDEAHTGTTAKAYTGFLVVYIGGFLLVLETEGGPQLDFIRRFNPLTGGKNEVGEARIISSTEDIPYRAFGSFASAFVNADNSKAEPIEPELIVKGLSDINLKMLELGVHLGKLSGTETEGDLGTALSSLQSAYPDLPKADAVVSAAVTELAPTLAEFLELFDTPTEIDLESENVWPAPAMLAL